MNNTTILLRKWTKDEDDLLRSLYPDTSMSKMQAALNRGKQAIRRRAELLGITRSEAYQEKIGRSRHLFTEGGTPWNKHQEKSWTDDDKKNLAAMRENGLTVKEIAKKMGRSEYSVKYKIQWLLDPKNKDESLPVSDPIDNRPHGWNMRPKKETIYYQQMAAACSAIEQALDSYVLTKDKQSHVHIS